MKIAYLIIAHNNPKHLQRLINALSSESSAFFIHIDSKSTIEDFSNLTGKNISISTERTPVYWGGFSQIEATLILLRQAIADPRCFDYYVLLSGVDYPLHSASYIENFFERNIGKEFIDMVHMPCAAIHKPISRLTTYQPSPNTAKPVKIIRKLLVAAGVISTYRDYKLYLRDLEPYAGSNWWALSHQASEYIKNFIDNEPQVYEFFRHTVCPDESFFQTILGNSPFKSNTQRSLTYADWSGGGANPATISETHLDLLTQTPFIVSDEFCGTGEILFARKFSDAAEPIVNKLDKLISE